MIPFLKNKKEASVSGPVDEVLERKPDDDKEEEYGMLDAVAEDLIEAVHRKDKDLLKSALEALVEHIMDMDEVQDQELMEQ